MSRKAQLITVVVSIACLVGVLVPASASAARPAFDGSCELSGIARFGHPVTNDVEPNRGKFRSQPGLGNCLGTLSIGDRVFEGTQWPVRARARATGEFSCLTGSLGGRASVVFLDGDGKPLRAHGRKVRIRAVIAMAHAVAAGSIEFAGAKGSSAGGTYNFTPSLGAVAGCAEGGDESLPMTVRYSTRGKLVSLGRRR